MDKNRERNAGEKQNVNYPFTSKIKCGICGKNYKRKKTHGRILWKCSTYLRYGKNSCPSKQIPDDILISLTTEVLELKKFEEVTFEQKIKEIQVPGPNQLVFLFNDGRTVQKEWQNKSRSESWSEETKQKARERSLRKLEGRS